MTPPSRKSCRLAMLAACVGLSQIALATPLSQAQVDLRSQPALDWRFERLVMRDGNEFSGFLQSINEKELEFLQVFRRPGQPMSATLRIISPTAVEDLERLPPDIRSLMLNRFRRFKQRAAIEAGNMDELSLTRQLLDGQRCWHYRGQWFTLDSTADESSTRRCIVRIEQIFRAFRQLLPQRSDPRTPLTIHLYGSLDEYHTALRRMELKIRNLAFYASRQDLIVTGAELSEFTAQLAKIKRSHQAEVVAIQKEYDRFREHLRRHSESLTKKGFTRKQIQQEMGLRTAAWNKEHEELLRKIQQTNRRNDAKFEEVTARMFRRLYHEAFHAYLDRFVCGDDETAVDRWLNEGLAQVFESGQLEDDTLRIDAPDPKMLKLLQRDLAGDEPLALSQLLAAEDRDFLTSHATASAAQHYLYAWGLAYYLSIHQGLLYDSRIEWYLGSGASTSAKRLEELTDKPLAQFEAEWHRSMLRLQP